MRLKYLHRGEPAASKTSALEIFRGFFPAFSQIDELEECFVLRDVLAHNHLWEISYRWDESTPMELANAVRAFVHKDQKYERSVDLATFRTRKLRLHIFPIRVDRRDTCRVLQTACAALRLLESYDRSVCQMSTLQVQRGTYRPRFDELVVAFCEAS
jgi:hypothetical protein